MKTFPFIVVIIALVVNFAACERVSQIVQPIPTPMESESDKIAIGIVLPLTGRLAAPGALMKQGFDFAIEEINNSDAGHPRLKFIFEDDAGSADGAVKAFNKLIDMEGMVAILGPSTSSAAQAAFPIAQANQIVAVSPTAGARGLGAIGDFVFRVPLTTEITIPRGVEATLMKLGYQRVATLYDDTDLFSTDRDTAVREVLATKGVEVLTSEIFQSGDTDFSTQLTRIKALKPDAIFVSALPPEKPGILIQAHELGISVPFIVSSLTSVEVEAAGAAAEGAITFIGWLSTDDTPGNQAFVQNYRATFGMEPNVFATTSYASVYILAEAIRNSQSTDAISIRDALANIRDFDTVLGKFSFNPDGDAVYDQKALIVKDGILQPF